MSHPSWSDVRVFGGMFEKIHDRCKIGRTVVREEDRGLGERISVHSNPSDPSDDILEQVLCAPEVVERGVAEDDDEPAYWRRICANDEGLVFRAQIPGTRDDLGEEVIADVRRYLEVANPRRGRGHEAALFRVGLVECPHQPRSK